MELTIRSMTKADWRSVCEIYTEGLATGQASFDEIRTPREVLADEDVL